MFDHRLRKIGTLLGLLAILMSTLAPTISQVRAAHDPLDAALAAICTASVEHVPAGDGSPAHAPGPLHWQVCVYCGLLAHMPVLPGVPVVFAAIAHAPLLEFVVAQSDPPRVVRLYATAQPRAPPVSS